MNFCPFCSHTLLIRQSNGQTELFCYCGYFYPLVKKIEQTQKFNVKGIAEIMRNESDLPIADIDCEKCEGKKAFFIQMQTRSADEAMTIVYMCVDCKHKWMVDR